MNAHLAPDSVDTVTDNSELLRLPISRRENLLDELHCLVVSFKLVKVLPIELSLSTPNESYNKIFGAKALHYA